MNENLDQAFCYGITATMKSLYFNFCHNRILTPSNDAALVAAVTQVYEDIRDRFIGCAMRWNPDQDQDLNCMSARQYYEYAIIHIYPWIMALAIKQEKMLLDSGRTPDFTDKNTHFVGLFLIADKLCWLRDEVERLDQQRANANASAIQQLEDRLLDRKIPARRLGVL